MLVPAADKNILLRHSNDKTGNGEHYRTNIFLMLLEEHEYQLCRDKGADSIITHCSIQYQTLY